MVRLPLALQNHQFRVGKIGFHAKGISPLQEGIHHSDRPRIRQFPCENGFFCSSIPDQDRGIVLLLHGDYLLQSYKDRPNCHHLPWPIYGQDIALFLGTLQSETKTGRLEYGVV